ncbi:MAG: tRNA pseudouridine(55) synthase TruB [Lentimicrobiaceae bacterium]|jgi:tRNA pseudouridine55 synthase|nr:tRNA pseudouridine(55) synthase TruB [Lentimicrobiaceae bacterium]
MTYDFISGEVLFFDKPYGWSSFDVVNKVRNFIRRELGIEKLKIGHAGTLDPLATGLLILCTGAFTKRIEEFQAKEKEYTGTFILGATTPSFDLEKPIDLTFPIHHIRPEDIRQTAQFFTGTFEQVPPVFSAVKISGKRAYKYARQQEEVIIQPKTVTISKFEITRIALPEVDFSVVCSKGTYIRALARDFGTTLQSGAHLTALRRTRIGNFNISQACEIEAWKEKILYNT